MKSLGKPFAGIVGALLLGLATGASAQETPDVSKEDLHVYLLIGQSNMAGRAPFSEEEAKEIPRSYLLNGEDEWEPAKNPLNRYSTIRKGLGMQKLNPGYSFTKKMLEVNPKATIGLVVNAKGGSKIEEWGADKKFYKEIIRRAKEAEKTGTLKGILWHQGESNVGREDKYLDQLKDLVKNLRKDLDAPDLPFVAGEISVIEKKMNGEIGKLPKAIAATGVASSKGLKTYDRWHFDAESAKKLGERYAEVMTELLKN